MKKVFLFLCVIFISFMTACSTVNTHNPTIKRPINYGNNIYKFNCDEVELKPSVEKLLEDNKGLFLVAIITNDMNKQQHYVILSKK